MQAVPVAPPPKIVVPATFLQHRRLRFAMRTVGKGAWIATTPAPGTSSADYLRHGFRSAGATFDASVLSEVESRELFTLAASRNLDAAQRHRLAEVLNRCGRCDQLYGADLDVIKEPRGDAVATAEGYARALDRAGALRGLRFVWHRTNARGGLHGDLWAPPGTSHRFLCHAAGELLREAALEAGVPVQDTDPNTRPDVTLDIGNFFKRGRGGQLRLAGAPKEDGGYNKVLLRPDDPAIAYCDGEALLARAEALAQLEGTPRAPRYLAPPVLGVDLTTAIATPEDQAWLERSPCRVLHRAPDPGQSRYDRDWAFARWAHRSGADIERIARLLTSIPNSRVSRDHDGRRYLESLARRLKAFEARQRKLAEECSWPIIDKPLPAAPAPAKRVAELDPILAKVLAPVEPPKNRKMSDAALATLRILGAEEVRALEPDIERDRHRVRALRVASCGVLITKRVCGLPEHGDQDRRPLYCGHEGICQECAERFASLQREYIAERFDPQRVVVFERVSDAESPNDRIEDSRRARSRQNRFYERWRSSSERRWVIGVSRSLFLVLQHEAPAFEAYSQRAGTGFRRLSLDAGAAAKTIYDVLMEPAEVMDAVLAEGVEGELFGNPYWSSLHLRRYDGGRRREHIPWVTHGDLEREKKESVQKFFLDEYGIDEPWDPTICHCVVKRPDGRNCFCGRPLYHAIDYHGVTIAASAPGQRDTWKTESRARQHLRVEFAAERNRIRTD